MKSLFKIGVDIGSTTIKVVIFNYENDIVYKDYIRHLSDINKSFKQLLFDIYNKFGNIEFTIAITGSGGIDIAKYLDIDFVQEVIASTKAISKFNKEVEVAIELGGEDAKIIYLTDPIEQRMNGICAGGTGAFIDQMATLLKTDANGLNELAKDYSVIYPVASRCGVFAKTDIQPLINDGAKKEDIAMSIFNAVVIQTVSVLACGRKINGKVAFLGGPLYFLSELRNAFKRVLNLSEKDVVFPKDAQLYVAMGAGVLSEENKTTQLNDLIEKINNIDCKTLSEDKCLEPLFTNKEEYKDFIDNHRSTNVKYKDIKDSTINTFLGIDAGSTTTKAVLLDENANILYTYYESNNGSPLESAINVVKSIYEILPSKSKIVSSTVTGYGEGLIKKALRIDNGEVETIAHYKASKYFNKDVDFILDIGGQDMKCIKIKDGIIESIILNEACSSGCGSFLETFAKSLSMNIEDFVKKGIYANKPVDLGSRCTVFMNSKVKQAQKEGATISDISSGLSYSVVKNSLFKVIKVRDIEMLGKNIVVQGGTFYNDLVLRAFEKLTKKKVTRPSISGIMGAFGAALIAKDKYNKDTETNFIKRSQINDIKVETEIKRCSGCTNKCLLTINKLLDDEKFISGNRCERAEIIENHKLKKEKEQINLYEYKYKKVFGYKSLSKEEAKFGEIGIPRVLNMYENYPFWHTFFTQLGFRVVLSSKSSKDIYEKGITSIASETVCYPAKLVHGHIEDLVSKNINTIFYPCVVLENKESANCDNHYNCPIVISYSEVIKNNVESIREKGINYINPHISLNDMTKLKKRLYDVLKNYYIDIKEDDINKAVKMAKLEQDKFKEDIKEEGKRAVEILKSSKGKGIVLSGRPYHIDPEINHGIPELINSLGMAVLTEDSISHLNTNKVSLRVVNQWVYHSRLYETANYIKDNENLELVQLNSFGCGIDAITIEQVEEILKQNNKIYTLLKIDEGSNLGAIKIRLRSLKAAIEEKKRISDKQEENLPISYKKGKLDKHHTILCPQMAPIHFEFIEEALKLSDFKFVVLKNEDSSIIDEGLRYVNNDACYPAIIVIGQIISALKSNKYDLDNTSVVITQTGGGSRATNYIGLLRKALYDSGFKQVPVISLSANGVEKNGIIKNVSPKLINRVLMACVYGDLLMKVVTRIRPYEKYKGTVNEHYEKWVKICKESLKYGNISTYKKNIKDIIYDFDNIEILDINKPRVGLVGEILVKFHPYANNYLVNIIENEGGEAVVPELMNFILSCCYNSTYKYKYLEGTLLRKELSKVALYLIETYQKTYEEEIIKSSRFNPARHIKEIAKDTEQVISLGNQTGEGWLLTGEMIHLLKEGVNNIVCMQPFGCLPNHITGKGQMKELKRLYKDANIIAIDYDPSASETNQLNRIKLMLSNSKTEVLETVK